MHVINSYLVHQHTLRNDQNPRLMACLVSILILFLLITFPLHASDEASLKSFENANRLYETGEFEAAKEGYEDLLKDGVHSHEIFLNLGNCWMKLESPANAIVAYERGLLLSPQSAPLDKNLNLATRMITGESSSKRSLFKSMSLTVWVILFALPFTLFCIASGLTVFLGAGYRLMGFNSSTIITAFLVLSLITGPMAFLAWKEWNRKIAIATSQNINARFGPVVESESSFTIKPGDYLTITESRNEWLRVVDSMNRRGWITKKEIEYISPAEKALNYSSL